MLVIHKTQCLAVNACVCVCICLNGAIWYRRRRERTTLHYHLVFQAAKSHVNSSTYEFISREFCCFYFCFALALSFFFLAEFNLFFPFPSSSHLSQECRHTKICEMCFLFLFTLFHNFFFVSCVKRGDISMHSFSFFYDVVRLGADDMNFFHSL